MIKKLLVLMAVALLACPVMAADVKKTPRLKDTPNGEPSKAEATAASIAKDYKDKFSAGEFQIEVAGQARTDDMLNFDKSLTFGGNYYVTAGAGLHAAVGLRDLNEQFVDRVEFGLVGRVPIPTLSLALLFGVGSEWQRITEVGGENKRVDDWSVYAEAGPLFRLSKYLDIFAKVRGVRPIDGADREHIALIAGTAITF